MAAFYGDEIPGKSFTRTLPYTTSFASCPDREIQQNAQFLSSLELTLFFSRKENSALPELGTLAKQTALLRGKF